MNRAREWWERLGRTNQIIFVAASLGTIIALIGFLSWASTPEFVPLFSNLSAQDANAITEKLQEAHVPYRLTQGGTAIEVPAQDHDEWQMKLLSQNLPAQSSSTLNGADDILNSSHMGEPQEIEDLRIRRSREDRIARTIMSMDDIASAVVHYAPADDSPLLVDHHDSSASVLLTLKPGHQLSDENVRAIVRLVQMAFTGLSDKNISVVDSNGDLLWDGLHMAGGQVDDLEKQAREQQMQERADLQAALDRALGPHRSIVLVHEELSNDQEKRHIVTNSPGAPVTKYDETEQLNGQGTAIPRAQVGAAGNIAAAQPNGPGVPNYMAATTGPNSNYTHETTTTTYQPTTSTVDTTVAPGQIRRLDVSVLLDSSKIPADQLQSTIATVTQMVQTAIGYDPNDPTHARQVAVSAVPFDHSTEKAEEQAAAAAASAANMRHLLAVLIPFLIMGFAVWMLARALRRPSTVAEGQLALAGGGSLPAGALGSAAPTESRDGAPESLPGQEGPIPLVPGSNSPKTFEVIEEAFDANLESILHLTRSKPEMVAMLVKSWLGDEN
ncbi:MAG TPA: flagellar basal-body MS-ring/collar protein FliF [Chthonomonas sp.]|uniref:flagellar basal-body MS-ring/collar protein FliF n=1 Tax=Chthonomonas sp. TaxID=2282153 RepID=UPI002B4ACBFF|nr:flagellar basal-body MS-ring/collar protein FliF [Chthonomonas sp.]HLH80796.1 flagellar basal-body MS-ring/collar protein FliF [Chthonomonas sp.]